MRMIWFSVLVAVALAISSHAFQNSVRKHGAKQIDPVMEKYLALDDDYRIIATIMFNLSRKSTWEDIRPSIAKRYGLSEISSWEDIREARFKRGTLNRTEDELERKEWAKVFKLSPDASWKEIRERVAMLQKIRKQ